MGFKVIVLGLGGIVVGIGAALAITNPTPEDFVQFATNQASAYLRQEACSQALPIVGNSLKDECLRAVDSALVQTRIRALVAEGSQRQNYVLFSRYRTELSVQGFLPIEALNNLPTYHVETLGILDRFRIYQAREKEF